ncbi:MAG: alpha/beta hydrolase fold domain-containing protein [Myxococcota bacterium]
MASEQHDAVMAAIPGGDVDPADPIEVVREKMHAIHPGAASPGTIVTPVDLGGIEAKWICTEENADSDRIVLHVHGGAFVSTVIDHYLTYGEFMSRKIGCKVVCFQWTWADEAPYPAAMNDTVQAFRALLDHGIDPSRVAFVGDSCGGGLALSAMCALRDAGGPLPACLVGLTPWLDAEQTGDAALNPRGRDPFVSAEWIRARFRDYAGPEGDLKDPGISPFLAKLDGLPPMYLAVGGVDTTADDATRLAERASREGASVIVDATAEMVHGYIGLGDAFPEATQAMERVALFVRQRIP